MNDDSIPDDVHPTVIEKKGNYAVAVVWSDGHKSSIYPYSLILNDLKVEPYVEWFSFFIFLYGPNIHTLYI